MHILFLTDNFPPEFNASASRVFERACYWVKWGHQVTVITCAPNFPEGKVFTGYKNKWYHVEDMQGIRVVRVKTFIAPNKGFTLRILDFLSFMFASFFAGLWQKKPDVIVASSPQFFTAVSGWALSAVKRKPFVFELADLWPASIVAVGAMQQSAALQCLEKLELFLYRRSQAIVALTDAFKKNLVGRGITADKIHVVINGADLSRYSKRPRDEKLVQQYHLENAFAIGYIGTMGMAHALQNVLHAANLLKEEINIQFLFIGVGAEREALMHLKNQLQLSNVQFIDSQPKDVIAAYWSICDVALVHLKNDPTFAEVIPSKLFEAMAMGLPILMSVPKGEATLIVEKEKAGLCIEPENPVKLAEAIRTLFNNKDLLAQLAAQSYAAVANYTREKQAQDMLAVLKRVISS